MAKRELNVEGIARFLCAVDRLRRKEIKAWVKKVLENLPDEELEKIEMPRPARRPKKK